MISALDAAWDLVKGWDMEGREALRSGVPKLALDAPLPGGGKLKDIAREVLDIARSGLRARAQKNAIGDDETGYLAPLDDVVPPARSRPSVCSTSIMASGTATCRASMM
jgi:glutamate--cysteine ligase